MPEDEVVEMEMVPEAKPAKARRTSEPFLTPSRAKLLFLVLAGIAGLALLAAVLAVVLAPSTAVTILVIALVILAVVVVAEIVLLLVARPRQA